MITKGEFLSYEKVRRSGITNTLDLMMVSFLTGLSKKKITYIMEHYGELKKKYGDNND